VKTLFPTNPAGPRARSALTILEMLVSTAMLALIVLGLTSVFIQVQKAFKIGMKETQVSDTGRTIMDMVSTDLRQVSDAQVSTVTNLYWSWAGSNQYVQYAGVGTGAVRTNQQDDIFFLVHTNTEWTGIGYAVSNSVNPCLGTLYRFAVSTNFHLNPNNVVDNTLFAQFYSGIVNQSFGSNWHAVADGVIDLKLRAFDQNGNDPFYSIDYNDPSGEPGLYPITSNNIILTNLPHSIELEMAVLEPDAIAQARAIAGNLHGVSNFLANAAAKVDVFRQRINIPTAIP
jgi:hypothetical protein